MTKWLTARIEWGGGVMLDVEADISSEGILDYKHWIGKEQVPDLASFRKEYLNTLKYVMEDLGQDTNLKANYEVKDK